TAVLDNFNRSNGSTLGPNWIDQVSSFWIQNHRPRQKANGTSYIEWNGTGSPFGANQEAYVTLNSLSSAPDHSLTLKAQGTTWNAGHIRVSYIMASSSVTVSTFKPPSTWTTYGTLTGVTLVSGDRLGARALSTGAVQVFRNTVALGTVTVPDYASVGGRIGVSCTNASGSRFDDFGGGTVTLPTALIAEDPVPRGEASPLEQARALAESRPGTLALSGVAPNPTTGSIRLSLTLPSETDVSMPVFDLPGPGW